MVWARLGNVCSCVQYFMNRWSALLFNLYLEHLAVFFCILITGALLKCFNMPIAVYHLVRASTRDSSLSMRTYIHIGSFHKTSQFFKEVLLTVGFLDSYIIQLYRIVLLLLLRHSLSTYPWLAWNSIWRPGGFWLMKIPLLLSPKCWD